MPKSNIRSRHIWRRSSRARRGRRYCTGGRAASAADRHSSLFDCGAAVAWAEGCSGLSPSCRRQIRAQARPDRPHRLHGGRPRTGRRGLCQRSLAWIARCLPQDPQVGPRGKAGMVAFTALPVPRGCPERHPGRASGVGAPSSALGPMSERQRPRVVCAEHGPPGPDPLPATMDGAARRDLAVTLRLSEPLRL